MNMFARRLALSLLLSCATGAAFADNTPQTLPFSQDWSDAGLITTSDSWSGVPGIEGFRGDGLAGGTGVDPQTIVAADSPGVIDVNANQTNPNTFTTGGVSEFQLADNVVALAGSGTARAPYLKIYLDTTGASDISVAYNLRDIDGSADNAVQPVALQYRVGNTGDFVNVPAAFVADASTGPSLATLVTAVSVTLPAAAENQLLVELRIMTTDAVGSDEWIGIDDIAIASGGGGGDPVLSVGNSSVAEGDAGTSPAFFAVSLSQPAGPGGVSFDYATADDSATVADGDYVAKTGSATIPEGASSVSLNVDVNGDIVVEVDETFFLDVSNVVGGSVGNARGTGTIVNDDFVIVAIHAIQGAGDTSPLENDEVVTEGIVTGRKNNGFFLQSADADADADPATSQGIFVFTAGAPPAAAAVGNRVRVQGTVVEFIPAADPFQLPLTEITFATVTQLSTGHPLPTAVALAVDSVDPEGPLGQLERYEGMRVTAPSFTVVAPTRGSVSEPNATGGGNGQFAVVVTGVPRPLREPGIQVPDPDPSGTTATNIPRWDFNPEIIAVDSDTIGAPQANLAAGCRVVDSSLAGPLDYTFRRYTIYPNAALDTDCTGAEPRPSLLPTADHATFATYNLQRFFDTINDPGIGEPVLTEIAFTTRLNKASLGIRNFLQTPDILGVTEVENLSTLQALATKINADAVAASQPNPQYVAYLEEGNDVGGIDVGFLVKTAEVAPGVARIAVAGVVQEGEDTTWVFPGTGESSLLNDRPPLVLDGVVNFTDGRALPVTAIVVHQRSLGGVESEEAQGTSTEGDRVRQKRQKQAEFLAELVDGMQTADPERNIVVFGDFNAFEFNDGYADAMGTVTGLPSTDDTTAVNGDGADLVEPNLTNATLSVDPSERYSFVFENNAQSLEHVLVNQAVLTSSLVDSFTLSHARINADFPETARSDAATPTRLSDHDPVVLLLRLDALQFADLAVTAGTTTPNVNPGATMRFDADVTNNGPDAAEFPGLGFALDAEVADLAVDAPTGWTCDTPTVGGGISSIACTADTLADAATADFVVTATAPASASGQNITLTAAATSQTEDPDTGDNSATAAVSVNALANLSVAITGPATVAKPSVATYDVLVENAGPVAAPQTVVTLAVGVPSTNASVTTPEGWECVVQAASLYRATCSPDGGALAIGEPVLFQVSVSVAGRLFPPRFAVQAAVNSAAADPDSSDNTASLSVRLGRAQ